MRLRIGRHLDETKTFALSRIAIRYQFAGLDSSRLRELVGDRTLSGRIRQIPYVKFPTDDFSFGSVAA